MNIARTKAAANHTYNTVATKIDDIFGKINRLKIGINYSQTVIPALEQAHDAHFMNFLEWDAKAVKKDGILDLEKNPIAVIFNYNKWQESTMLLRWSAVEHQQNVINSTI